MPLLLLVSIQVKTTIMSVFEHNLDLLNDRSKKKNKSGVFLEKEIVLCNHCKRTASNGIRCLGMCVADNDY